MTGPATPAAAPPAGEGRALRGYSRFVAAVAQVAAALAAAALLVGLALIGWAVVMRYAFNRAPVWVDDIVGFSLVAVVMLAAADTLRRGQHFGVDVLVTRLAPGGRRWAQAWSALATIAIAAVLVVNGWQSAMFARMLGMVTEGQLEWPVWALMLFMPFGGALLLLAAIEQLWRALAGVPPSEALPHGAGGGDG